MRLMMELFRSREGRLEGTIQIQAATESDPVAFSGILELLKVLEDAAKPLGG